jgi:hypothetical protein
MPQKRSFIDRLLGVSTVDNEADPGSALNRIKRVAKKAPVLKANDQLRQHIERIYNSPGGTFGAP